MNSIIFLLNTRKEGSNLKLYAIKFLTYDWIVLIRGNRVSSPEALSQYSDRANLRFVVKEVFKREILLLQYVKN